MAVQNEWPLLTRQTADRNNITGPLGHGFTPTVNIWITQFGRYFVGSVNNHIVRVWQLGVTGAALASATILVASSADGSGYKWVVLGTPLALTAGTTYLIVSEETNAGDAWGDLFDLNQSENALITFYGSCFNSIANGNYPNNITTGVNGYNTATFKFDTVNPNASGSGRITRVFERAFGF